MHFSLRKDIFNHKDICCFFFFNNGDIFFIINIYSNSYQSTLKYLKSTEADIWNILIIAGNFNIRDNDWDPLYPFHSIHSDTLLEIVDFFDLNLSSLVQQISTWYSDNTNNSNLVIDLFFLWLNSIKINKHIIYPKLQYPSDHTLLTINISITEEFI